VVRETPLSEVHLENMLKLARMGVSIVPPMPAFYNHPQTVDDIVNHIVARVLDQFDIAAPFAKRWDGHMQTAAKIASVVPPAHPAAKSGT
jgi:4-hydroxy-3-polyprenylbenzoate decarboxylase